MGKTETIKERSIYIYLPTVEMKRLWEERAQSEAKSISKWVVAIVESHIASETMGENASLTELNTENKALKEELADLTRRVKELGIIKERYERELRAYRAQPFLDTDFEGVRKYNIELVELLRSTKGVDGRPRLLSDEELMQRLGIQPTEEAAVKALSSQLSNLEAYGLVSSSPKGWRWRERA